VKRDLRALPSFDELAKNPAMAAFLPPEIRARLVLACSSILAAIATAPSAESTEDLDADCPLELLTVEQAAERANVPESWIRQAVKDGRLPSVKLGHYRRIKPDDLRQLIEERVQKGIEPG
jgi:excisionase family DNA binding protein